MFLVNEQEIDIRSSHQLSSPMGKKILNKALNMGWWDKLHDKYLQTGPQAGQAPPSQEL